MKKLLFALVAIVGFTASSFASHISGMDLTYEHISGNDYLIRLQMYRDCSGLAAPSSAAVGFESVNCSQTFSQSLPLDTSFEVTGFCQNFITTCNFGFYPGTEVYYYSTIVTLPGNCDDWRMYYSTCCRNTTVNLVSQPTMYIEAWLDNLNYTQNSSPFFVENPHPYACVNQPFCINNNALEPDGDSLVFSFTPPLEAQSTSVPFNNPHTYQEPIPGATIDSTTGNVCFTPTQVGNWVLAVKVEEFDTAGNLKATVYRDMQITVINCNTSSVDITGTVTDSTGAAVATGVVDLYEYAGNEQLMTLVSSTNVNNSGVYNFNAVTGGKQYVVKAFPDTANYPGHYPTYHDSTYYWAFANVVNTLCDTFLTADVKLGGYASLNYFYYLSGNFANTNKQAAPVADADIYVLNENNHRVMAHTRTDSNGDYLIEGLPAGSYYMTVDFPACPMDSTYHFNLNDDTIGFIGMNFWTDSSFVYINPTNLQVGVEEAVQPKSALKVFPNPYSDATNIVVNIGNKAKASLFVYNSLGEVVQKLDEGELQGVRQYRFSAKSINQPQGVYFVRLVTNGQTFVKRLVEIR